MNQNEFKAFTELMRTVADYYRIELKPTTVRLYWNALAGVELEVVKRLCNEHVQTAKFMPAISELLETLKALDGRPGVEEAWSICAKSLNDERVTIVWTDEMAEAFGCALGLQDDRIAARMAFKERYESLVSDARKQAKPVRWTASLGHDPYGREGALLEAVTKGRVTLGYAQALLPYREQPSPQLLALIEKAKVGQLPMFHGEHNERQSA